MAVTVDGLEFEYRNGGHRLAGVSLHVAEAEVCALLGPNGAGKTTLLRCVLGLLAPRRGSITIAGQDITTLSTRELARLVAYVPQSTGITFPFSTLDVAVMGRTPHFGMIGTPSRTDLNAAESMLDLLGVGRLAERPFASLSGGERQLVLLARALLQQAPVLVLDEPTAALDYGNEIHLLGVIAELASAGRTVLMSTHQPDHALAHATRTVLMRDGRITADGPSHEVITGERLTELYGTPLHVTDVSLPEGQRIRTCVPVPTAPRSAP
ncbi:ABC transporter ATP-binding protein [Sciscionella marina]|uniref:ABC transporter ATP-binding protein n=1 Tax=Sciscionella marina TaxID=508770 RepID=UPI00038206E9|nr:ABC transporter ATP-binding protein [Sciscionella marina]